MAFARLLWWTIVAAVLGACLPSIAAAQVLTRDLLERATDARPVGGDRPDRSTGIELVEGWKFQAGDNPAWAAPEFDDRGWETRRLPRQEYGPHPDGPPTIWSGIGWYRLHLTVDESLANQPVGIQIRRNGQSACEVYLDGKLVHRYGVVSGDPRLERPSGSIPVPVGMAFDRAGEHVLAIRYSCTEGIGTPVWSGPDGADPNSMVVSLSMLNRNLVESVRKLVHLTRIEMGVAGALTAFAVLHFLLFLFYRREKANLYYSLFAGTIAFVSFVHAFSASSSSQGYGVLFKLMPAFDWIIIPTTLYAFLHAAFSREFPRYFRYVVIGLSAGMVTVIGVPLLPMMGPGAGRFGMPVLIAFGGIAGVALIVATMDAIRLILRSIRARTEGAWIITGGLLVIPVMFGLRSWAETVSTTVPLRNYVNLGMVFAFPFAVSVYLAFRNGRVNTTLAAKLAEVERLSAVTLEQERREAKIRIERELENARLHALQIENEERARAEAAIRLKNDELERKNRELIEAHQQADRIFSALAEALPGTVLDGKYRLDERIGSGGFGVVFRATQLSLGRHVAVKVFKPMAGNDSADAVERFKREGISASRLNHPNAIQVVDSGISTDGVAYLVMELLTGRSLGDELKRNRRLSIGRALQVAIPVCRALAEAHRLGIIHRDIKPDNVFLNETPEGEVVKVVDFGIAKLLGQTTDDLAAKLTATGGIIGTPVYMAPERLTGGHYDGKSDVYSVGVMLYESLAGRTPFDEKTTNVMTLLMAHIHDTPPPLTRFCPECPTEIEETVMAALVKQPAARPDAAQLANRLEAALIRFQTQNKGVFISGEIEPLGDWSRAAGALTAAAGNVHIAETLDAHHTRAVRPQTGDRDGEAGGADQPTQVVTSPNNEARTVLIRSNELIENPDGNITSDAM